MLSLLTVVNVHYDDREYSRKERVLNKNIASLQDQTAALSHRADKAAKEADKYQERYGASEKKRKEVCMLGILTGGICLDMLYPVVCIFLL